MILLIFFFDSLASHLYCCAFGLCFAQFNFHLLFLRLPHHKPHCIWNHSFLLLNRTLKKRASAQEEKRKPKRRRWEEKKLIKSVYKTLNISHLMCGPNSVFIYIASIYTLKIISNFRLHESHICKRARAFIRLLAPIHVLLQQCKKYRRKNEEWGLFAGAKVKTILAFNNQNAIFSGKIFTLSMFTCVSWDFWKFFRWTIMIERNGRAKTNMKNRIGNRIKRKKKLNALNTGSISIYIGDLIWKRPTTTMTLQLLVICTVGEEKTSLAACEALLLIRSSLNYIIHWILTGSELRLVDE